VLPPDKQELDGMQVWQGSVPRLVLLPPPPLDLT
jgi:hypothetical protein